MTRLRANGTDLNIEVHGSGPPILLTHGFGATSRMWYEQIEEFTDRFRLILWDLPGHGESPVPQGDAAPDAMVATMKTVLDAADAGRVVLMGLGLGGSLSLRFWRAYPQRVRGLVLIGTMPGLRSGLARQVWNARAEAIADAVEQGGLDALKGGAEIDPHLHAGAAGIVWAARTLLTERDDGALPWLRDIDVPVLVLVGRDDRPHLSAAEFLAHAIPQARIIVIPRADHAVNVHKPDAVNGAVLDFLGRLPP